MAVDVPPEPPWRKHLERAHRLAHAAARAIEEEPGPSAHLEPAARKLERGVVAMYDAFDGRGDRVTSIGLAHARLWDAAVLVARAGLPAPLAALREACSELVSAEERAPRVAVAARAAVPLRAGGELLPLHTIERASLAPAFHAPPLPAIAIQPDAHDIPEPSTFEELAAAAEAVRALVGARGLATQQEAAPKRKIEAPEAPAEAWPVGFAVAPPERMSEDDFVRRWARECIEEIGMLGLQRAPLPGDDWRACQALERRLVASIDALAALGPVAIASVEPFAMDAPVADPMRIFAATMIGGCLEGRDAIAFAERVLHRFGAGDPPVAEAFVAAMKLAPHPMAIDVARQLHASTDAACRAIGLEVLAHRGWLTEADLGALADERDTRLLTLALPALAAARSRDLDRAIALALASDDLRAHEAALDAMALAAHPDAASAAREAARGALGDRALVRLAIVADEDDARWLLDHALASPTSSSVEALGWAGHVDAVPALLRFLELDDEDVKLAAGAALDRLLGAQLVDSIEVMPEAIDDTAVADPDPEARPPRKALAEVAGDARDRPPEGSTETLDVPSIDPERWRAYWAEHGRSLDPSRRHRRGQPYAPSVSLHELDHLLLGADDRRRLHRELAARTGRLARFDPHDLVAAQEESLRAWAALVRGAEETPGAWARHVRH